MSKSQKKKFPNKDNKEVVEKVSNNEANEDIDPAFLEQINFFSKRFEEQLKEKMANYESQILEVRREAAINMDGQKKYYDREMDNIKQYALQKFVGDLLPIIDSLEFGLTYENKEQGFDKLIEGIKMTHAMFLNILKKYEVEPIPTKIGDEFNDALHECVSVRDDFSSNKIANVLNVGYKLQNRVIRPSRVIVGTSSKDV